MDSSNNTSPPKQGPIGPSLKLNPSSGSNAVKKELNRSPGNASKIDLSFPEDPEEDSQNEEDQVIKSPKNRSPPRPFRAQTLVVPSPRENLSAPITRSMTVKPQPILQRLQTQKKSRSAGSPDRQGQTLHTKEHVAIASISELDEEEREALTPKPQIFKTGMKWFCALLLFFYYVSIFALLVTLLIIHLDNKRYFFEANTRALETIVNNLSLDPILSITPAENRCPTGMKKIKLATWPKVQEGCYTYDGGMLFPALCDFSTDNTVYSLYKTPLYKWEGLNWCVQTGALNVNYVREEQCPSSYRECAPGLCVSDQLDCPITKVSLTAQPVGSVPSVPYGDRYLNIWREQNKQPLQTMQVNVGQLPCFVSNEEPVNIEPFVLVTNEAQECLAYGFDASSFEVDTDTQADFLSTNNVNSPLLDIPEYQKIISQTTVVLAGITRIEVNPTDFCLHLDLGVLSNAASKSGSYSSRVSALTSVIFIVHLIIGLILLNVIEGRVFSKVTFNQFLWSQRFNHRGLFIFFLLIENLLATVLAIYLNLYWFDLKSSTEYFEELINEDCFVGNQAKQVIENYEGSIPSNLVLSVIFSLCIFTISVVYTIVIFYISRKKAKIVKRLQGSAHAYVAAASTGN